MSAESLSIAAAASYAILMLVIGLPIWFKTTEVYRVTLPYSQIQDLSELQFKLKVTLQLVSMDNHKDHQFGPEVQKHLQDSESYTFSLSSRAPTEEELKALQNAHSISDLDRDLKNLHRNILEGTVILMEVPEGPLMKALSHPVIIGATKCVFFTRKASARDLVETVREVILGESTLNLMRRSIQAPNHDQHDTSVLRRVTAASGYDLLFSLLVPQPESVMVTWNIKDVVDTHFQPFLQSLGNLSSFTVESQVLYLTSLNVKPRNTGQFKVVSQKDLGLAINPVESQLASHVSSNPRLNFLAYVPTEDQTPLHILDGGSPSNPGESILESNAFLIPKWGGVAIYNPELKKEDRNEKGRIEHDMEMGNVAAIFLTQLRELLGLQKLPENVLAGSDLHPWERDFLFRLRTAENLLLTRVTLQSLAHLLSQISNIVINDEIGDQVFQAVHSCQQSDLLIRQGNLDKAFENSKKAFLAAEKAFFDPSLLALLYFPEDQKYAIYIPLFLPVGVPVAMSLKTIYSFFKSSRSKAKAE